MKFSIYRMLQVKDVFLTPIFFMLIYVVAMYFRPKVTTPISIKYYLPALYLKLFGSIALGLVYQFYYGAGDTTSYFYHARFVTQAFYDSPAVGLEFLFSHGQYSPTLHPYTRGMFWYGAPSEFMVVRFAGLIGVFTFSSYMPTAMIFASLSFMGMWAMFATLLKLYPNLHKQFAIALFYMPSVFFWGSGLMKDSLCMGGLGLIFYAFYRGIIERRKIPQSALIIAVASYPVLVLKSYVLLSFLPPAIFWVINEAGGRIRNKLVRRLMAPIFMAVGLGVALLGLTQLASGDARFDFDEVAERAKTTSEYIYRVSVEQGGAAYTLGQMDGTIGGLLAMGPQAINVTLFRPYLWEVRNVAMLLTSLESTAFFYLTVVLIWRTGVMRTLQFVGSTPILQMCFVFSLLFSMSVGLSTNNFGTLARYKVQMMPFYLSGLYILEHLAATARLKKAQVFARA